MGRSKAESRTVRVIDAPSGTASMRPDSGRHARFEAAPSSCPTHWQVAAWSALLVAAAILFLRARQSFELGAYRDDASYVVLAQSLRHADHYGLINAPGQSEPTQFPVGYPLLLAAVDILAPARLDALKAVSLTATLLNATILFWGWRPLTGQRSYWWGVAVAGLYALSPEVVRNTRMVMSEPAFTTCCLIGLLLAERAAKRAPSVWQLLLLSATLTLTVLIRTAGVVLVVTVVTYLLVVRGRTVWRQLLVIGLGMVGIAGLTVATTNVGVTDLVPRKYVQQMMTQELVPAGAAGIAPTITPTSARLVPRQLLYARPYVEVHIPRAVILVAGGSATHAMGERLGITWLPLMLGLLVCTILAVGAVRCWIAGGVLAFPLFAIFYLGVLVAWPRQDPARFLYPIQPQLETMLLFGLDGALGVATLLLARPAMPRLIRRGLLAGFSCAVLLIGGVWSSKVDDSRQHVGDLQARAQWLKDHTSATAVVMTEEPQIDFLYGSRKTVGYPAVLSAEALAEYLDAHQITEVLVAPQVLWHPQYVATYSGAAERLRPLLADLVAQQRAQLVYASERSEVQIFEVQRHRE